MSQEDKQRIIEMHRDLKWMKDEITKVRDEAQSEVGYKRCVAHKEQMESLSRNQEELKTSVTWLRNTFLGGLVSAIIAGTVAAFSFLID